MTTPPPQKPLSPHFPAGWQGGVFNHLEPLTPDYYDEDRHALLERVVEMTDWAPLEGLTEGDPPEVWGRLDAGTPGSGAGPRQTEPRSGAVLRMSASGVVLDDHPDTWLNLSRFSPPVDLRPVHVGDIAVAEVEVSTAGRCYLTSIRVIPLDGFDPEPAADAKTHGPPETEHMELGGDGR